VLVEVLFARISLRQFHGQGVTSFRWKLMLFSRFFAQKKPNPWKHPEGQSAITGAALEWRLFPFSSRPDLLSIHAQRVA